MKWCDRCWWYDKGRSDHFLSMPNGRSMCSTTRKMVDEEVFFSMDEGFT